MFLSIFFLNFEKLLPHFIYIPFFYVLVASGNHRWNGYVRVAAWSCITAVNVTCGLSLCCIPRCWLPGCFNADVLWRSKSLASLVQLPARLRSLLSCILNIAKNLQFVCYNLPWCAGSVLKFPSIPCRVSLVYLYKCASFGLVLYT